MTIWLFFHLFSLGTWLGCVIVEGVLEIYGARNKDRADDVAILHHIIDKYVELPLLILISVTGFFIFDATFLSNPLYVAKMSLGVVTVLINFLCVISVFIRKYRYDEKQYEKARFHSTMIYWYFYVGIFTGFCALVVALYILSAK